jgi:hypothetical protein
MATGVIVGAWFRAFAGGERNLSADVSSDVVRVIPLT